jgi:hypothetical protein
MPGLFSGVGLEDVRGRGDQFTVRCPFHWKNLGKTETEPDNLWISYTTGLWICFSCQDAGYRASGRLIDLIAHMLNRGRKPVTRDGGMWAALKLMRQYGVDPVALAAGAEHDERPGPDRDLLNARLATYVPAWALNERGITAEAARDYDILWDHDEQCFAFPVYAPESGGRYSSLFSTSYLSGFQFKPSGFGGKPWCSTHVNADGDEVGPDLKRSLFGYRHRTGLKVPLISGGIGTRFILVESPLDCSVLHGWGFSFEALATYGAKSRLSFEQWECLRDTDELILAYDNDPTGKKKARALREEASSKSASGRGTKYKIGTILVINYYASLAQDVGKMTEAEFRRELELAEVVRLRETP